MVNYVEMAERMELAFGMGQRVGIKRTRSPTTLLCLTLRVVNANTIQVNRKLFVGRAHALSEHDHDTQTSRKICSRLRDAKVVQTASCQHDGGRHCTERCAAASIVLASCREVDFSVIDSTCCSPTGPAANYFRLRRDVIAHRDSSPSR